jgi:glycosyltransferase involved in cell wall biosynthesis
MSEFEAQGIAVLEALAAGCRAVVARSPGLAELADGRLARGVPLDCRPEELAAIIVEELNKPALEPSPLPTWDECADRLLQVYEDVVRQRATT